ncbi:MAG TPA: hypothetical protein VHQ45_15185 [Gemmatimonadaceae bacterium]|nr:hypothetical protein [Gemmatimonadaceae bacterium]
MSHTDPSAPAALQLQFDAVEPVGQPSPGDGGITCQQCSSDIRAYYYEAGGVVLCGRCKNEIEEHQGAGGVGTLGRATLFGLGGAIAGAALYYLVRAITGYELGLIAIVVGYMVGWLMQRGARGRGGRRYQVVAVLLTYLAIGSSYVPLVFEGAESAAQAAAASDSLAAPVGEPALDSSGAAAVSVAGDSSVVSSGSTTTSVAGTAFGVGAMLLFVLALPLLAGFSELPSSLISLLIVAIALHQAWKMLRHAPVTITGPYQVGSARPPADDR